MAENDGAAPAPAAASNAPKPEFRIQRVYLKDVSFESPQAPKVFVGNTNWKPNVSLHLNTESSRLENDVFECVLVVTATVAVEEETVYLCEVKQAGLFTMKGFPDVELGKMLGSFCPNILFPFAREEIGSLVQKGGFPQLLLEPVNFDALYTQHLQQARQNAPAPETPQ